MGDSMWVVNKVVMVAEKYTSIYLFPGITYHHMSAIMSQIT